MWDLLFLYVGVRPVCKMIYEYQKPTLDELAQTATIKLDQLVKIIAPLDTQRVHQERDARLWRGCFRVARGETKFLLLHMPRDCRALHLNTGALRAHDLSIIKEASFCWTTKTEFDYVHSARKKVLKIKFSGDASARAGSGPSARCPAGRENGERRRV